MLINPTVDGLYTLNMPAMARALLERRERADHQALSFEERLGLLVDLELQDRENRRLQRSLKTAKLRGNAVIEDLEQFGGRADNLLVRATADDAEPRTCIETCSPVGKAHECRGRFRIARLHDTSPR